MNCKAERINFLVSQLIIGANSLIQAAIPEILNTPEAFHRDTMRKLENNALICVKLLSDIPGLTVVAPQGISRKY